MLNYFSYDKAGNMEVMHQKQVFLDATPPIIEVTFSYEPHESESEDTWKSNLNIEFYAIDAEDEEVVCTTNLYFTNSDGDRILAQQDPDSDVDFSGGLDKDIVYASSKITPLQIIYRNLRDDYYEFEYECYDSSGNKNSDFKWIDIDGDKSLTDIKVNNIPVPATITSEKNPANALTHHNSFDILSHCIFRTKPNGQDVLQ